MSTAAKFLLEFGHALATMALYRDGHPARARAVEAAYQQLHDLQSSSPRQLFTFLGEEVVHGTEPLRELKAWDWGPRLAGAGVQRLEFETRLEVDEFEALLEDILARLSLVFTDSPEARQLRSGGVRFGTVGLRGEHAVEPEATQAVAKLGLSLADEVYAVRWIHDEVQRRTDIPMVEAEAVVRSLTVAMHADQQMMLPLLQLRRHDEYTTTHALNVSVLAMALAEFLHLGAQDVRTIGIASLLHDIGKVNIPQDVLNKPGKLTPAERALINTHPAHGARIILQTEKNLDLAAVVAYEHHVLLDGGGYPQMNFCRTCHYASRLAHVCDVFDALRTHRPYRAAWPTQRVLAYITERAGTEFDVDLAHAFVRMMQTWEHHHLDMPEVEAA